MTDAEYPEKAAYSLLNKVIMEFRDHFGDGIAKISADTPLKFDALE